MREQGGPRRRRVADEGVGRVAVVACARRVKHEERAPVAYRPIDPAVRTFLAKALK